MMQVSQLTISEPKRYRPRRPLQRTPLVVKILRSQPLLLGSEMRMCSELGRRLGCGVKEGQMTSNGTVSVSSIRIP
jgi:hypothetical protein